MTALASDSRFIIGIDLGTTNCVVSYVDRHQEKKTVDAFPLMQCIASGELDKSSALPSFCYLPLEHELAGDALKLPWKTPETARLGIFARNHGAGIPERFIASAKSWLAHKGIDRLAGTLPWGSEINVNEKLSPVEVSRLILNHIRQAWNHDKGKLKDNDGNNCTLEESQVVVTVPASFDEVARELTVKAAKEAGYKNITLLEEPLAAFYAWLDKTENWQSLIQEGETILIVDVGGGTTDFSLINFEENANLRRTAVGNHLLLGGDNIDMTLARNIETQIGKKLNGKEWSILCQRCRQAKEELLNPDGKEEVTVAVTTAGSSLIGNTLTGKLQKQQVLDIIMNGFYPLISSDAASPEKKSGIRDLGLPYERDPSISAHLLEFLKSASKEKAPLIPDKVLFNGGSMIPPILRQRVIDLLNSWSQKPVSELPAWDLDRAVGTGAGYYGQVRCGEGVRVQGGIARAYYMEVASDKSSQLLCIMPRDTNEGDVQHLDQHKFTVKTNEILKFPVHSSATRLEDQLGDSLEVTEEISELPPLITALQFGKSKQSIEVELSTILTETGTLEVWLSSTATDHKWQLKFDMRALHNHSDEEAKASTLNKTETVLVSDAQVKTAKEAVVAVFNGTEKPGKLMKSLEEIFQMSRTQWPLQLIRQLADFLLDLNSKSFKNPALESRWLNLTGFCLRPGFGDSADELRIKKIWSMWFGGPSAKTDPQVNAEWWVFWRRIAGGLNNGRQEQVTHTLMKSLMPNDSYKKNTKYGAQEKRESWRCLGSMERTSLKLKQRISHIQLDRISRLEDYELWALARLNSRHLFYGPVDLTLPAKYSANVVKLLIASAKDKPVPMLHFALSQICAFTNDVVLDINDTLKAEVITYLQKTGASQVLIEGLTTLRLQSAEESKQILGDSLPIGLEISGTTI
jgi:molecular chaperone DnaK (HSP70)